MNEPKRRPGLVGPVLLISLGILLLLNNLGVLTWGVWEVIWRLWPVLLIAAGIEIIFGRQSALGGLLAALVIAAAIGGAVWLFLWQGPAVVAPTSWPISVAADQVRRAEVEIKMGAGRLLLGPGSDPGYILQGQVQTISGADPLRPVRITGDKAKIELRESSTGRLATRPPWDGDRLTWNLQLSDRVPLELEVETGAGVAQLNLHGLQVAELEVKTGVGSTTLTLPRHGPLRAEVEGGVGETVVIVPRGAPIRIRLETGLGSTAVKGSDRKSVV